MQQADAFDTHFYFRSRANLAEEFGLPPQTEAAAYQAGGLAWAPSGGVGGSQLPIAARPAAAMSTLEKAGACLAGVLAPSNAFFLGWLQGLSLDLQGLAACLALLPRNAVLSTDAFSEDSEGEEEGEGAAAAAAAAEGGWHGAAAAPQQDSGPAGKQQQQQQHGQQRRPSGQPPRQWETTAAAQKQAVPPAAPAAPAAAMAGSPPSATGAAVPAQPDSDEADELLTELLGPEPAPPAGLANSSSQVPAAALASGRSAAPPPGQKQPASVPSKLYHPVQQRPAPTQQPAAPVAGRGAVPVAESQAQHPSGHDSELDFLLGLPSSSGSSKQGGTGPPGGQRQQQEQGSLEDWLDAL